MTNAPPTPANNSLWQAAKSAGMGWLEHNDAKAGAALAYYSIFSMGPLIVIVVAIAGLVFGREAVQEEVTGALKGLVGDSGAKAIDTMLAGAEKKSEGVLAMVIGVATLIYGSLSLVVQLKDALNAVWETKESRGSGFWDFARTYVFSFAGVITAAFLMLISMVLTAALTAIGKYAGNYIPEGMLQVSGALGSFIVICGLFALMFKWLPNTKISWRDVWLGAVATAALFEIGKFLIAFYIGTQGLESSYGAAASIVVVLIWVYYTAQIILLGAEFVRARALQAGRAQAQNGRLCAKRQLR